MKEYESKQQTSLKNVHFGMFIQCPVLLGTTAHVSYNWTYIFSSSKDLIKRELNNFSTVVQASIKRFISSNIHKEEGLVLVSVQTLFFIFIVMLDLFLSLSPIVLNLFTPPDCHLLTTVLSATLSCLPSLSFSSLHHPLMPAFFSHLFSSLR